MFDLMDRYHELEVIRRSLAMAPIGSPGLDREQAIALLAEAQALHGRLQRLKEGVERTLAEDNSAENR
jgi:hypothetical protein